MAVLSPQLMQRKRCSRRAQHDADADRLAVQRVVGGEGDQIRNGRVGDERFLDLERRHLLPRPAAPQPKGICLWQNRSGNVHRPKP